MADNTSSGNDKASASITSPITNLISGEIAKTISLILGAVIAAIVAKVSSPNPEAFTSGFFLSPWLWGLWTYSVILASSLFVRRMLKRGGHFEGRFVAAAKFTVLIGIHFPVFAILPTLLLSRESFPFGPGKLLLIEYWKILAITMPVVLILWIYGSSVSPEVGDAVSESIFDVPCLAVLPLIREGKWETARTWENPTGYIADLYRLLRIKLKKSWRAKQIRISGFEPVKRGQVIAFTCSYPSNAYELVSLNLGASFGSAGTQTIVVDLDFRRPTMHHLLNISNNVGVTNVLVDRSTLSNSIRDSISLNLSVLPSGQIRRDSPDALERYGANELLLQLAEKYELVICNLPSIGFPETYWVASLVNEVYVVITPETPIKELKGVLRQLKNLGSNVQGLILNGASTDPPEEDFYLGIYEPWEEDDAPYL